MDKREQGRRYELFAANYLQEQGYQILEQNFCCRQGEVDIIAREGRYLVFVEVKYRRDLQNRAPAEAVDFKKQQKIRRAAQYYLYKKRCGEEAPCRFDVVAIAGEKVSLLRDAF